MTDPVDVSHGTHKAIPSQVVALLQPFLAVTPGIGSRLVRG